MYNQQPGPQTQPMQYNNQPIQYEGHAAPPSSSFVSPPMQDPMIDGLAYFPALVVKQKINSLWENLCNSYSYNIFDFKKKYAIFNPMGDNKDKILSAKEKSGYCTRMCLAEKRHFHMVIKTNDEQEAIYFERPYRLMERGGWCCCGSGCGYQALRVYAGEASKSPDSKLDVQEDYYCLFPVLSVYDEDGTLTHRIKVKSSCSNFCCRYIKQTFEIYEASDLNCSKEVGKIKKRWTGAMKELFTDADNFFIEFPVNATAKHRAVLLGALFFIDYLYYEDGGCHLLACLGAPLTGPCACLACCGECLSNCCENSSCDCS